MSIHESNIFWATEAHTSSGNRVGRVGRLAGWATIAMFFVWIGFTGLAFVWNLEQRALFHRAQQHPFSVTLDDVHRQRVRADFLTHAIAVLFVITAVVFITWLYSEYRQLDRSNAPARFAPGWAIGGWFVPFLNLVRPLQVVEDVWKST